MSRPLLVKSVFLGLLLLPISASALTLSPTKIEVAGDPGQELIGEIELQNEEPEDKTFYLTYENFEPKGETGAPYFVGGNSGLTTWISTQESVTLRSGEKLTVPYRINIPADATAGGYFAAIFFGTQPPQTGEGAEVAVGGKAGSLILLRVNGDISEAGGILDFMTASNTRMFTSLPVQFSYRFNNTGADRVVPKGDVTIKNSLSMTSAALSINKNEGSVLPNSTRKFEVTWDEEHPLPADATFTETVVYQFKHFRFGVYKASIEAVWGESSQRAQSSFWFIVVPWQLLLVVSVLAVIFRYLLRSYNTFVIESAKKAK